MQSAHDSSKDSQADRKNSADESYGIESDMDAFAELLIDIFEFRQRSKRAGGESELTNPK